MRDEKLIALSQDLMSTMFGKPKVKRLRPLVKQLTYKGITKKWTFDGTFLNIIGTKYSYDWELYKEAYGYDTIEDAIKNMIEKEIG